MATIFTKIIKGEIPSYKIYEDENYFAFLDINPLVPGHTIVVPKKEIDYIFDLDNNTLGGLLVFAQPIAKALQKSFPCRRIGIEVIGLEVPHAHVHLLPINSEADLNFSKGKMSVSPEELTLWAEKIIKNL
jgi:histidine triad (HIT) family protein